MPTRDGRLSVKEILLRSALPALEAAADRRRRGRSASWEDCAAIFECLDGDDDGAITIEEFRGSSPIERLRRTPGVDGISFTVHPLGT